MYIYHSCSFKCVTIITTQSLKLFYPLITCHISTKSLKSFNYPPMFVVLVLNLTLINFIQMKYQFIKHLPQY